jgi:hypothetical protein
MSERHYICRCGGKVSIPSGSRTITLDEVRATHDETCPAPRRTSRLAA